MRAAKHGLHNRAFVPSLCLLVSVRSHQDTGICCSLRKRGTIRPETCCVCSVRLLACLKAAHGAPSCQRAACARLQGPPGTGKTRTILGLLSIILHASPANTAGLVKRAAAQPMPEYLRKDMDRLWRLASPWLAETANPRHACAPQPMSLDPSAGQRVMASLGLMSQWHSSSPCQPILCIAVDLRILGSSNQGHHFADPHRFVRHPSSPNRWRRAGMQWTA